MLARLVMQEGCTRLDHSCSKGHECTAHSSDVSSGPRVELRGREAGDVISIDVGTGELHTYIWKHYDDVFSSAMPFCTAP